MPGSKGFALGSGVNAIELFIVRTVDGLFAYRNRCPHTGSPLDWMPDQFLSLEKTEIQCATHDARFRIADGYCTSGPCTGDRLSPIPVHVINGQIAVRIAAAL